MLPGGSGATRSREQWFPGLSTNEGREHVLANVGGGEITVCGLCAEVWEC